VHTASCVIDSSRCPRPLPDPALPGLSEDEYANLAASPHEVQAAWQAATLIHDPDPVSDVHQERADRDGISRTEAKRRTMTEVYGGDPMLIRGELITPEPLASELKASMTGRTPPGPELQFPELQQESTDAPRTLRDILFTHRALVAATALETTDLMAALEPFFRQPAPTGITTDVVKDARQQRDNARGQDRLFNPDPGRIGVNGYEAQWIKANPGLSALLWAVPERMICKAENPYGTEVCTLEKGHDPYQDVDRVVFDHYDGGTKIAWSGDILATENREPDPVDRPPRAADRRRADLRGSRSDQQ
jgi:hypothetical protein